MTTRPSTSRYVGFDVHKRSIVACIVDAAGKVVWTATLPGGSRTIKSLDRVYAEEGLPQRKEELPPGEREMLKQTGCDKFAKSLASDQLVPRKNAKANC